MSKPAAAQIMLLTPAIDDADTFLPQLEAALAATPVAAIGILFGNIDPYTVLQMSKKIVTACQDAGAAAILRGHPDIVGKSGSDGLHMNGTFELKDMVTRFHPEKIVGAGGLRLKDDAMQAGELNVDYVMFGEPESSPLPIPFESIAERVQWWAEIFEVPCVGYAPALDNIPELIRCNADFIALGNAVWEHPEGAAAAMQHAAHLVATTPREPV